MPRRTSPLGEQTFTPDSIFWGSSRVRPSLPHSPFRRMGNGSGLSRLSRGGAPGRLSHQQLGELHPPEQLAPVPCGDRHGEADDQRMEPGRGIPDGPGRAPVPSPGRRGGAVQLSFGGRADIKMSARSPFFPNHRAGRGRSRPDPRAVFIRKRKSGLELRKEGKTMEKRFAIFPSNRYNIFAADSACRTTGIKAGRSGAEPLREKAGCASHGPAMRVYRKE